MAGRVNLNHDVHAAVPRILDHLVHVFLGIDVLVAERALRNGA
jgi:hypothetical protein